MDKFENKVLNEQQEMLKQRLDFSPNRLYIPRAGDCIVTLDVIYKDGKAAVGIDITRYPNTPVQTELYTTAVTGTYIPGYFSFYEGPVLLDTIRYLATRKVYPDIVIVDGHGLAHPRKFGLACYVGVHTSLPVIGIAKESLLPYDKHTLGTEKYASQYLNLETETVGVAIRLQENINPVFISAGNRITADTAVAIIKQQTSGYKNPDNMRRADAASRSGK
jgi:deoxyribonuclease V